MAIGIREKRLMEVLEKAKESDSDEMKEALVQQTKKDIEKDKERKQEKKRKFKVLEN
jgi:hypothetical protein